MLRRILLISLFMLVAIGLGTTIYFVFFRTGEAPQTQEGTPRVSTTGTLPSAGLRPPGTISPPTTGGGLPIAATVASGGVTKTNSLISGNVLALHTGDDGGLRYYNKETGKLYRVNQNGAIQELSSRTFFNVSNVTWSSDVNEAILEYPDGSNIAYNFDRGTQITLPKHWEEFDFAPTGNQITGLSIGVDPKNRWLFIANSDGTGARMVEPLGENADKVQVAWSPNDQVIAFSNTGEAQGLGRQQILLIGKNRENFRGLIVEGLNFEGAWSPDGAQVLYSVASPDAGLRPTLWIVNGQGDAIGSNRRNIGLNTWVDKCTFSDPNTLYCAVPETLPEGAGLQREIAASAQDQFFKVNLRSGVKTLMAIPEFPVNAKNLSVASDGTTLFFQDALSDGVYSIRLK